MALVSGLVVAVVATHRILPGCRHSGPGLRGKAPATSAAPGRVVFVVLGVRCITYGLCGFGQTTKFVTGLPEIGARLAGPRIGAMPLTPGTRLGHYEIQATLGAIPGSSPSSFATDGRSRSSAGSSSSCGRGATSAVASKSARSAS
jgi:hypothetical protein